MDFPERLRELRESRGYSQEQLSEMLEIPRSSVTHYEQAKNDRLPRRGRLEKIADFFNVSMDYLLGRTDDPRQKSKNHSLDATAVDSKIKFFEDLERELGVDLSDAKVQKMLKRVAKVVFTDEDNGNES